MEHKRRGRLTGVWAGLALGVLTGVVLVWLGGVPSLPLSEPRVLLLIVALPLLYTLCIAVHEAGHIAAAKLVGFRPMLFIAGPLRVERVGERLEVGWNRSFALAGGLALCVPVTMQDVRRRTLVMAAGGPVASLMFGVQCLALWMATSSFTRTGDAAVANLFHVTLAFLGIGSLLIGMVTLLPTRMGGFYSDGARILRLLRSGPEVDAEVALITVTGQSLAGMRPRDWDAVLVEQGAGIRDGGPFEVCGQYLAYAHALDRGDEDGARSRLREVLRHVRTLGPAGRASMQLAAATFRGLYDRDAEQARALLALAGRHDPMSAPHQRRLAEAAVLLAEGDPAAARAAAEEARSQLGRAVDRGSAALDDALAERIIAAAEASVQRGA